MNRPKDFSNCIERLGISLARALMSFVLTQNISYDLKLAVNVPDTVYDELKIFQRPFHDSPMKPKCAWMPLN